MTKLWRAKMESLRGELATCDPARFLECATIQATMYVGAGAPWTADELQFLAMFPPAIVQPALADDGFGGGQKMTAFGVTTNGSFVQQLANLLMWEDRLGARVREMKSIVEIGGGFGAMALMCHRLGFRGTYAIHDFPEVYDLASRYLSHYGVRIVRPLYFDRDLLIACHSLDEMALGERQEALGKVGAARSYLFRYSEQFDGVNNELYFRTFKQRRPDYYWWGGVAPGFASVYHAFGERQGAIDGQAELVHLEPAAVGA